jgi:hypothetical protein
LSFPKGRTAPCASGARRPRDFTLRPPGCPRAPRSGGAIVVTLGEARANFGLEDITDIPARHPGAAALKAKDLDQARIEAARLWEEASSQENGGRLPDGYWILDTEGFVLAHGHVRGKFAPN